jgi:hypothetical protein
VLDDVADVVAALGEQVVDRDVELVGRHPEADRQGPLRVEVDEQHPRPYSASAAPRLMVVVVLPTPPFWLHMAMTRAGPWEASGRGREVRQHPARRPDAPSEPGLGPINPGVRFQRASAVGGSTSLSALLPSPISVSVALIAATLSAGRGCALAYTSRSRWTVTIV